MTGQCCVGGPASRGIALRLSRAAASILPAAVLVFLPKCPLCLGIWLTAVTGFGFSAAGAAWLRGLLVVFWVAAAALAAAPIIRPISCGIAKRVTYRRPSRNRFR